MTRASLLHRIDFHHHYSVADDRPRTAGPTEGGWSPERSIEDMDAGGVATAILSTTSPSLRGEAQAARLARQCNEYAARLVQDHPGRFGMFTALPLRDTEGSLREAEHGLDTLGADGVGLFTNYGDKWLGDPAFDAVFEELNRRGTLIFVHPLVPDCCVNVLPGIGGATIEYATDTTRAIANWMFSGSAARYPNLKIVWSHGGGTMPFLYERLQREGEGISANRQKKVLGSVLQLLQGFYYELAQASHQYALAALTRLIPVSQLLWGSDFPSRNCSEYADMLGEFGFNESDLRAIECGNAFRLLPRLESKIGGQFV